MAIPEIVDSDQEFEKAALGYGYQRQADMAIGRRVFKIYEKPPSPQYILSEAGAKLGMEPPDDSLTKDIEDLLGILNQRLVCLDGFDQDHAARRNWAKELETSDPASWKIYWVIKQKNKLSGNRIKEIEAVIEDLLDRLKDEGGEVIIQLQDIQRKFIEARRAQNYDLLSLADKLSFMENVDKILTEFIDFLRQLERQSR